MSINNQVTCPCLLIAAPSSGSGKTTLTAALARHHSLQGRRVSVFKAGPDFIDPMILRQACGADVYSLDFGMMSADHCSALLYRAAKSSDMILIEGVMGLYDGQYSAADIAKKFGIPIALVVDVRAMAETFAALVYGMAKVSPGLKVIGAFANRTASERHRDMAREGLNHYCQDLIRWLGDMPYRENIQFPERHLGLVQASELQDIDNLLNRAAALLEGQPITEVPPEVTFSAPTRFQEITPQLKGMRIALARDKAFSFIYAANIDFLEAHGAQIFFVSPLSDKALPECDLLYFPGGYPELYAHTLAANHQFIAAVAAFRGKIIAECGGMIYLAQTLRLLDTNEHIHLCRLLPLAIELTQKLQSIGWQKFEMNQGALLGHSFHYTSSSIVDHSIKKLSAEKYRGGRGEDVYITDTIFASYLHWYFPSNESAAIDLLKGDWPV